MAATISRFVREVGLPTALLFTLGWVSVKYWIEPQAQQAAAQRELIAALGKSSETMAASYANLSAAISASNTTAKETRNRIDEAFVMMAGVPAYYAKDLENQKETILLLNTISKDTITAAGLENLNKFTEAVSDSHEKTSKDIEALKTDHQTLLEALGNPPP